MSAALANLTCQNRLFLLKLHFCAIDMSSIRLKVALVLSLSLNLAHAQDLNELISLAISTHPLVGAAKSEALAAGDGVRAAKGIFACSVHLKQF